MHDDDLSPQELSAFRALPRERDPGEMLEHRTVRALRARNLLRQPERRGIVLSLSWVTAAAAVLVAVFTGGFAIGQWLENRQNDQTLIALRQHDAAQAAAMVQQTGSAYLAALSAFTDASRGSRKPHDVTQGREVASSILHAAANHMVQLSPEDPLALQILRGLERTRSDSTAKVPDATRQVAWF
jgi:hypothetical protein